MGDAEQTLMPFGKHKGEKLGDVPPDYLEWCLGNVETLTDSLRSDMQATLKMLGG